MNVAPKRAKSSYYNSTGAYSSLTPCISICTDIHVETYTLPGDMIVAKPFPQKFCYAMFQRFCEHTLKNMKDA